MRDRERTMTRERRLMLTVGREKMVESHRQAAKARRNLKNAENLSKR